MADLWLLLSFLCLTYLGISLNLISFQSPTHVFQSDASEHSIGGICAISGKARSIEIPPDFQVGCHKGTSLNLFEFLGEIISIWIEILAGQVPPGSYLIAQGDSTLATGWLRKSNFQENNHPLQLEVALYLAFLLLDARVVLYSHWFTGKENGTSDVLSQDTHLTFTELTDLLNSFIPEQVPPNFAICLLPPTIYLWLISLLWSQPLMDVLRKEPTRRTIWLGQGGCGGCNPSSYSKMNTSMPSRPGPGGHFGDERALAQKL